MNKLYSKEEINQLPIYNFSGDIVIIKTDEELSKHIEEIHQQEHLGFDTETKPVFKKGVEHKTAVLQLATENKAYIIQLKFIKNYAPIKNILESKQILKTGVAIQRDLSDLQKIFLYTPKNFEDLADHAIKNGLKITGLRNLTANLLNKRLTKSAKLSNWELKNLKHSQIQYAASDAQVSFLLYYKLKDL